MNSYPVILKAWDEWGSLTGRYYQPIETYRAEDAEYCIVTMGSYGETAMEVVDTLREEGEKVGVVKDPSLEAVPLRRIPQSGARQEVPHRH